ncbi:MAG: 50S ribosomal protein L6 [Actinobacteria bacterium]|nr:50S ribosomal protein L6 [Actinomycetota bacterium]
MSRIGKQPVSVPKDVKVQIESSLVTVSGPKGSLSFNCEPRISVAFDSEASTLIVTRAGEARAERALHGTTRATLANMVVGVTQGFSRIVLIEGVGYTASTQGRTLLLNVGFANQVRLDLPQGVEVQLSSPQRMIFSGPDKQAVNAFAARVRSVRLANPYHQKGMRYEGEVIRRKAGKAFATGPA